MRNFGKPCIIAVSSAVLMIILPIPTLVLDILLALNLIFALFILLIEEYSKMPTDFTLCPTLLRVSAHFGLLVNISAARLILTKGEDFDGLLIRFASSWIAGSGGTVPLTIGLALFFGVLAIHIMLITKEITRVEEAAARFTVDSVPEKQMAINAKLGAGIIDEKEFTTRKELLQKETAFYDGMKSAAKFIYRNEKIRILIIALTIPGSLLAGVLFNGGTFADAVEIYIPLVIGSGLLSMLPPLLISTTAGIVVTESSAEGEK